MNFNKSFLTIAWRITAIAVLLLLIASIFLVNMARSQADSGFTGYITSIDSTVFLRRRPNTNSAIVSILDNDISVFVKDATTWNDNIWYHIETQNGSGWIPEDNLTIP